MEPTHKYSKEQVREWAFFELRDLGLATKDYERYTLSLSAIKARLKGHPDEKRICTRIDDLLDEWGDDELFEPAPLRRTPRYNTEKDEWEDGDEEDLGIDWKKVDAQDDL